MLKGLEHLIQERLERTESVHPGEEKDQGNLINVYEYLMGGSKAEKARLPSTVASDWTGAFEHRLKYGRFHLKIKRFFTVRVAKDVGMLCREVVEYPSLEKVRTRVDAVLRKLFEQEN